MVGVWDGQIVNCPKTILGSSKQVFNDKLYSKTIYILVVVVVVVVNKYSIINY